MADTPSIERRRQYCSRCGQWMFDFYRSPDGHYGVAGSLECLQDTRRSAARIICCPSCRARYQMLDRLSAMGHPVEKL